MEYHTDPLARDRFSFRLEAALLHVDRFPDTLTRNQDVTSADVYLWLVKPFWLAVRKRTDGLTLVAVPHCSRDLRRRV